MTLTRTWWSGVAASVVIVVAMLFGAKAGALAVPAAPSLDRPIVDQAGALSAQDIEAISSQITAGRTEKDYQIGVLIIPTLGNDEYLEGYTLKVAREWGIGEKTKDNGVLLLIVINDRKMRIEVGRGLEGDLTDLESGRIIRNVLAPEFRRSSYAHGISKAIQSIQAQVERRADPNAAAMAREDDSDQEAAIGMAFAAGFGILSWLGSILARSRSWWLGGVIGGGFGVALMWIFGGIWWSVLGAGVLVVLGLLFDFFVSHNYASRIANGESPSWWAGGSYWGSGSGSSSGGFGGFGGGGFGGGGASGGW